MQRNKKALEPQFMGQETSTNTITDRKKKNEIYGNCLLL